MKILLVIFFAILLFLTRPVPLPQCSLRMAIQALPPRIFQQTTTDASTQNTLITRFFHNKAGIFGAEFGKCYFNFFDPVLIAQNTLYIGLLPWLYLVYNLLLKKNLILISALLILPIFSFMEVNFPFAYLHNIFAIMCLVIYLKDRR